MTWLIVVECENIRKQTNYLDEKIYKKVVGYIHILINGDDFLSLIDYSWAINIIKNNIKQIIIMSGQYSYRNSNFGKLSHGIMATTNI